MEQGCNLKGRRLSACPVYPPTTLPVSFPVYGVMLEAGNVASRTFRRRSCRVQQLDRAARSVVLWWLQGGDDGAASSLCVRDGASAWRHYRIQKDVFRKRPAPVSPAPLWGALVVSWHQQKLSSIQSCIHLREMIM